MKSILLVILFLSILAVPVMAQVTTSAVSITALHVLGKGIATSPSDPMDFMIVKFGIGKVRAGNTTLIIGVLKVDDEKYRLKEVTIGEGKATGKIYKNDSEVGSFDLSSVMKGDTEIWAGTMVLNGNTYNTYVIEGVRPVKAAELKEKVVEYCTTPSAIDTNCRDRLGNYCENNPNDSRCRALFKAHCLTASNMDDTRCRYEFRGWCKENPTNKYCIPFELKRAKYYCEEHSDSILCKKIATEVTSICEISTDNEGCAVVKKLVEDSPSLLADAATIRSRISDLTTSAISGTGVTSTDLQGGG